MDAELEGIDFSDIDAGDEVPDEEPEVKAAAPSKKNGKSKVASKVAKAAVIEAAKPAPTKTAKPAAAKTAKPAKAAPAKVAKPVKTAKAVKAAKPAKAARLRAEPGKSKTPQNTPSGKMDPKEALKKGLIKLDEKGRDLPYKAGSTMRFYLEQAMQPGGVSEDSLEKWAMKNGYDHRYQRAVLVSGQNGGTAVRPYATTHTWKVEVKAGRIRVYDVKRVAFYKKIGRLFKK
jgi:hypothetical protein